MGGCSELFVLCSAMEACLTETTAEILPQDVFFIEYFFRYTREVISFFSVAAI